MDYFHANRQFNPYGTDSIHKAGCFLSEEQYSTEKKIEIASMIEKHGLLTSSSASKTQITNQIAEEADVSVCFVQKVCNRLCLARYKSQQLGRGTRSLSEEDEHSLVYLYRQQPLRDVQSYIDNLYLLTGTLAHPSVIFHFFKPLQVYVPSFPAAFATMQEEEDENFPPRMHQDEESFSSKLAAVTLQVETKMPDHSMISSFGRCGISSSCGIHKRTRSIESYRENCDDYDHRPRIRRRLDIQPFSQRPSIHDTVMDSPSTPSTSLVVYRPPSFSAGMIASKPKAAGDWVPRPPPAEYHGNPQSPSFACYNNRNIEPFRSGLDSTANW